MRTNHSFMVVAAVCGAVAAAACGGSVAQNPGDQGQPDAGGDDAATMPAPEAGSSMPEASTADASDGPVRDHGAPSMTYPAFKPDMGQIIDNGGVTLSMPVVVSITWNSDPSQAMFDAFSDSLGPTQYWAATTTEYGVGALTSGMSNHVHLATAAPAQLADSDLQSMVTSNAGATWPAPTDQIIYAFYLPPSTSLQFGGGGGGGGGDACQQGIGGYHDQVNVGGHTVAYAVVPSCNFGGGNTPAEQTTMSMSHELIEAVTDPHPQDNNPGYVGFDADHFAFDYFQRFSSEVGDACEFFRQSFYQDTEASFMYWVQRTWSNKSGAAGHDPCVPAPAAPYFNVTPLQLDTVNVDLSLLGGSAMTPTKGVHVPMGQTVTFPIGFYSDGPTGGPWTVQAVSGNPATGSSNGSTYLKASIDKTSGQNGEKAYVTVTTNTVGRLKGELLTIVSTLNGTKHYMPILVGSE
jgi:hypothetical protein